MTLFLNILVPSHFPSLLILISKIEKISYPNAEKERESVVGSDGGRRQQACERSGPRCLDLSSEKSLVRELASEVAPLVYIRLGLPNRDFILFSRFLNLSCQRSLTRILSFKDQWHITDSQTNSTSDKSKGDLRDPETTHQEVKAVKKTSLFEEDDEDDLFAVAKDR